MGGNVQALSRRELVRRAGPAAALSGLPAVRALAVRPRTDARANIILLLTDGYWPLDGPEQQRVPGRRERK